MSYCMHILMVTAFVGDIPKGMVVNHIDEDKLNNHPTNLEVVSRSYNNTYRGVGVPMKSPKYVEVYEDTDESLTVYEGTVEYSRYSPNRSTHKVNTAQGLTACNLNGVRVTTGRKGVSLLCLQDLPYK